MERKEQKEVIDAVQTKEGTVLWLERKYNNMGVCIGIYLTEEDEHGNILNTQEVNYEIEGKDILEFRVK